ncbi:hypothetical protein E3V55_07625 [Candidatus Marinimicrobia bacterium MT.SAG.3]|nr:hypothetical protein E3V55_07625 [Candidatus Marinimicrobia bacterium MT.SAG.3]
MKIFFKHSLLTALLTITLAPLSIVQPQNAQSQLAQRIMLENHLRMQAENALKQALGDERFFVSVKADISFTPAHRSEQIWEPAKNAKDTDISQMGIADSAPTGIPEKDLLPPISKFDPVLPGFPDIEILGDTQEQEEKSITIETEMKESSTIELDERPSTLRSFSIERTSPAIPEILRLEVTVMLEDGISQKVLDSVRPVVQVATGLDYQRGDILDIVTTSFVQSEAIAQLAVEASMADTISITTESDLATRMRELEDKQRESEGLLPLYIGGAVLGLIVLLVLAYFWGRSSKNQPHLQEEPTNGSDEVQMLGTPAEMIAAKEDKLAALQSSQAQQRAAALERDVHRADLKNTRQAIITLSVGKPDTATKILNNWISSEEESEEEL